MKKLIINPFLILNPLSSYVENLFQELLNSFKNFWNFSIGLYFLLVNSSYCCKVIIAQLGSQVDRDNPENALILKTERKVQEKIKKMIERYIRKSHKQERHKKDITITYNPLTSHLYFKTTYLYIKSFLDFYKDNAEFLNQIENENENIEVQINSKNQNDDVLDNNYSASNIALSTKNKNLFNQEKDTNMIFN